jgi:hypothetical protein
VAKNAPAGTWLAALTPRPARGSATKGCYASAVGAEGRIHYVSRTEGTYAAAKPEFESVQRLAGGRRREAPPTWRRVALLYRHTVNFGNRAGTCGPVPRGRGLER